jgi:hypothetical protein
MFRKAVFTLGSLALLASLALTACGGGGDEGPSVRIDGAVDRPTSVNTAMLDQRPHVTQTVQYLSGSTPQQRSYVGADLWSLLSDQGVQTDPGQRNDTLNRYVLATASDGYRTVFALGELDPSLGNKGSMLAYAEIANGSTTAIGTEDGPFRVTAPGDVRGGRYVSQLVGLEVRASQSVAAGSGGGASAGFTVSGAVGQPMGFDLAQLQALPASTVTVGASTYTGVSLWHLLNSVTGLTTNAAQHNALLGMYVVATGSDGYKAMLSLGEIHPNFGNRDALLVYAVDGAPLDRSGVARLVVPRDARSSRHVSNLIALEVMTAP